MKKPFMIGEARLPEGFPPPGPAEEVIIKQFPKSRAAVVQSTAVDGGENKLFGSLFNHIKSNNIAMSAMVDMTWSDPDDADDAARETAMAFIYGNQPHPLLEARNIHYEFAERTSAIGSGGIGAIHSLVRHVGLQEAKHAHVPPCLLQLSGPSKRHITLTDYGSAGTRQP